MALTLLPVSAMAEGPDPVAQIGEKTYATLKAAFEEAKDGDTVTLLKDVETNNIEDTEEARIIINKAITLNLNDKTIQTPDDMGNNSKNFCALIIDADVTINATAEGGINTGTNGGYGINVRKGATLTINGGTYYGGGTAVQVQKGTLIINDGHFSCGPYDEPYGYKYLINCIDAAWKNGTAKISIKGGTFVKFDPSDSASENPNGNFLAEGYGVKQDGDNYIVTEPVAAIGDTKYPTFAAAITAAEAGGTVTLLKDTTEKVSISKNLVLDLNGKTLTGEDLVNSNGKNERIALTANAGEVKVKNGIIDGRVNAYDSANLTIDADVTVKNSYNGSGYDCFGIVVWGDGTFGQDGCKTPKLTVNGKVIMEKGGVAISTNGNDKSCAIVTINNGAVISTTEDGAIYLPSGKLTMNGGTVSGPTGIQICAGSTNITSDFKLHNGTVIATGADERTSKGTGDGLIPDGAAISVVNRNYPNGVPNVTIDGGSFSSANSDAVLAYSWSNGTASGWTGAKTYVKINDGYFTSDPTAYLAAGKGLVTSDQSAFAYKVGDRDTDVETAVTAGEATVTIPADVSGITEDTVKDAANAADTTKTLTDTVAASGMTNDPAVVGTKEAAEAALAAKNISVGSGDTVTVVVQPYLEVNVKSAVAGKLTLEISAKYNVVATTSNPATIDSAKTVTLESGVPLSINKPIELTIALPTGFAEANGSIYVQHKGYEYTATVDASGTTATFINPHGFSTFTVTSTASAIAEVDGTSYTDLQKAVDAVANNGTITLLKDTSANAVVSRAVKFTLDKNSKSFTGAITAGSGYNLSVDGNVYTFTVRSSSGSSSGSSSSSRRYDVSAPSVKHGDVTVSPKSASKGDTVTITVKPDSGYELDTLTVKDANGSKIKVKDKGDGKFTFTMPASKVTVSAEFAEIETLDFADVSTDAYYYEAVKWAAKKGITGGTGDGTFNPNGSCTRAHIVTFLWRAAGSPEPKSTVSFADVPADSYYAKAVAWAVENGITLGTGDGTFSPNATCTRAQSVTFLYRALGTAPTTVNGFTDVTADAFYADAVAWAVESGVTNGTSASTFSPNNGCTRAQIVTFLYRAYQDK